MKLFHEQKDLGEDAPLREAILAASLGKKDLAVFDRGLKKRQTFAEFNQMGIGFVTRINPTTMYQEGLPFSPAQQERTSGLSIEKDSMVYLYGGKKNLCKTPLRLIIAQTESKEKPLFFLTNLMHIKAHEVAAIYQKRWEIETFFRFLKQELNFSHLLSRSLNGMKVVVYTTLIAAMLILAFRQKNNLKGFKIVKLKFVRQLELSLIEQLVHLAKNNPDFLKGFTNGP